MRKATHKSAARRETTTTLPPTGCNGLPDGATFSSVLCRLERLRDAVNATGALGTFQGELATSLDRGIARATDGRTRCDAGDVEKARTRLP